MSEEVVPYIARSGHDALWLYFSLSYASWLTLPRVMMHAMPDEWQQKMADLMNEWQETWRNMPDYETSVLLKTDGRFVKSPDWLVNYRHPDDEKIESLKHRHETQTPSPRQAPGA